MVKERFLLAKERIEELKKEKRLQPEYQVYFVKVAQFLEMICENWFFVEEGRLKECPLEELRRRNKALYEDILPENYESSYGNPAYSAEVFGREYGSVLSFLYAEMRSLIPYVFEQRLENMVRGMELFLELYGSFCCAWEESGTLPAHEVLKEIAYWYVSDYTRQATKEKLKDMLDVESDFALRIIEGNLTDERYLYYFGEYITESEIQTFRHLKALPEETLQKMADTYTEGYRIGFLMGNKDMTKKKTVNIRYCLGFEPMIKKAVENFKKMGLTPTIYRAYTSILQGKSMNRNGYYGAIPNKQFDFDHKDDQGLVLDKKLVQVRLEAMKESFETYKEQAAVFGGPAVVEIFGETPPALKEKPQALHLSQAQQKLTVEYMSAAGEIQNQYIKGEERSFTIIAFPVPEIGENFAEIFDQVIRINTLDYKLYQRMQQTIIDTLDKGKYVLVKGMNGNKTNLKVMLHNLENPEKQTNFENCVADVNIPVGEVFTSPVLAGTEGVLHVSRVYLNGLEYKNIAVTLKDGMVRDYTCENFDSPEQNRKYVKDNVLYHHESLPLGEFAIGTNTTAFAVARKYKIEDKLPILIAEKTGPHFALGDTCYSHAEEVAVYNPDGKEMIARDNEYSLKRKEEAGNAYFNCHTDITIPYDELGEVSVVTKEEEVIPIIEEGRFVLAGCEELNIPLAHI
ncbi:aminopeptidase [Parablautia muri]|uniref:Leucyl aminopeptidase n=1 Tax=Parablautia muri TaxID=2320879 RepID=A0A9X5BD65_9FIRM|nr:aminopeptidase [Parablautia muri]NBJ91665.1 leucyl aminopeptidase [Parablautia muri]